MILYLLVLYYIISWLIKEPESANRRFDTPYNRRTKY